jgi:hypothetical protein
MNTENNLQTTSELDNNNALNVVSNKKSDSKNKTSATSAKSKPHAPIGASLNDDSRANRPARIPIGSQRRLRVPERKGFVRRWVNDIEDRIEMFKDAGYTVVVDDDMPIGDQPSKDAKPLGATRCKSVGRGRTAYLMEIPEHLYKEDQASKIKRNMEMQRTAMQPRDIEGNKYGSINIDENFK